MAGSTELLIVGQVALAAALGAALGLERELGAQAAGLRTHMLVSLGAALFTIAGDLDAFGSDPARVAAQVVTGIGFLGGGAIFKEGVNVRGLTTAGSLWVTAAIGLAVGLRAWLAAIATTVLAVMVLWLFELVKRHVLPGRDAVVLTVTLEPGAALDTVETAALGQLPGALVQAVTYAEQEQKVVLSAQATAGTSLPGMAESLRGIPGVAGVAVSR
jgi:putative Mg2+ transporter-C (MgtC) family protein